MNPGGFGFPKRSGGVTDAVRFGASQSLTGAQLKQAGDNLALADLLGQNRIINGGFQFWQRGTSSSANGYVAADRFPNIISGGTVTQSRQTFGLNEVLGSGITPQFFLRQTVSGQSAAGDYALTEHKIEDVRSYSGQTVTLSFWARRSSGSGNMAIEFYQSFGTGGSPSSPLFGIGVTTISLTSSWARYTVTTAIPSVSARTLGTNNDHYLAIAWWASGGSTWNSRTNSLGIQTIGVDIWGVMINRGSTALEYIERPLPLELMLSQRYYIETYFSILTAGASQTALATLYHPSMRASPTFSWQPTSTNNLFSFIVQAGSRNASRPVIVSTSGGSAEWTGSIFLSAEL